MVDAAALFQPLYNRFNRMERIAADPPLLAHYTSIAVLQKMLEQEEVWFSNPLLMNDLEEMRFGIGEAGRILAEGKVLKEAGENDERTLILEQAYQYFVDRFENGSAFDTYVFCLCEHQRDDNDGLLSMWRGYGGHGNGAAIVFDTAKLPLIPSSPLLLNAVSYGSGQKRSEELRALLSDWAKVVHSAGMRNDELYIAAHAALGLVRLYALTTKHDGFHEEREWRVIYQTDFGQTDVLKNCLDYHLSDKGVEPKLKYKIGSVAGVSDPSVTLIGLIDRIILGPSLSSPLAKKSVERMLEKIRKPELVGKLQASTIPLRPVGAVIR